MLTKGSSARGSRPLNPGLHLSRGHLKCPRIGQKWRMHLTRSASKPLVMGQRVWLQEQESKKWSIGGVIKSIRDNGRSYVVETDGGAAYLRNRRYIKASTATARRNVVGASLAAVDKGKKREGVRFKLIVQFKEPGSKD